MNISSGISGHKVQPSGWAKAEFDGTRVRLPAHVVRRAELGETALECWLLVITPGRYRLIPNEVAANSVEFKELQEQIEEIEQKAGVLDGTDTNERAALVTRVIRTTAYPDEKKNWRATIPPGARQLASDGESASFVFVAICAGFIEIWFPDALRQADKLPIGKVIR